MARSGRVEGGPGGWPKFSTDLGEGVRDMCGLFHVLVLLVDLLVAETIIPLVESHIVNSTSNVSNFSAGTILQYAGYLADVTSNLSSAPKLPM